jgi:von Willebrand factor type D domain
MVLFFTLQWQGDKFDYHGGCDLVLISNAYLQLHIRTKNFGINSLGPWSGIVAVAVKIEDKVMEVQGPLGTLIVDNNVVTTLPIIFAGYPLVKLLPKTFRLQLPIGQYIDITYQDFKDSLKVDVKGYGSMFGDSKGLCGNWTSNSPNAFVGRDGTVYPRIPNPVAFAETWKVNTGAGDPSLFQTSASATCVAPSVARCNIPGAPNCTSIINLAKTACANVTTFGNSRENCEFDVRATEDVLAANALAYLNPLLVQPISQCYDGLVNVDDGTSPCAKMGGRCVFACNTTLKNCISNLCGHASSCTCEIPRNQTRAPTMKPVPIPTRAPIKANTTKPVLAPTRAPMKNSTSAPIPLPTRVPVKPNTTKPVLVPTRAPSNLNTALNATSWGHCRCHPDPHFVTVRHLN